MKCDCGFEFAGPGQFRNCNAFVTSEGHSGVICPKCDQHWVIISGFYIRFYPKQKDAENLMDQHEETLNRLSK